MKPNALLLTMAFCAIFSVPSFAQDVESILKSQQARMDSIEKKLTEIQKKQTEGLTLMEEIAEVIKNPQKLLVGSALVLGLLTLFFYLLKKIKPDWYMVFIQNWIDRYTEENALRRGKSILLLHPPDTKTDFIERFFKKYKFCFEKLELGNSYKSPEELPDIFFAFDEKKVMNQVVLHEYLEKHEDTLLFYFGQTGAWDFKASGEKNLNSRINLANARAQIFANLMSTLRYHSATSRALPLG